MIVKYPKFNLSLVRFQVLTVASMSRLASGMLSRVVWQKLTDISEVLTASIIREMSHSSQKTVIFLISS
jgi:hypothetical protein